MSSNEKFLVGQNVRLYGGPAFYRVRPPIYPLEHGKVYEVAVTKYCILSGQQSIRVYYSKDGKTMASDYIESTWFCSVTSAEQKEMELAEKK